MGGLMISLSATSYDPAGTIRIMARFNNPYQGKRRGSITATLDGGSSVYDSGYSITDQTYTASIKTPSKAVLKTLQYLVAYYSELIISCETGVFKAIPSFVLNGHVLTLNVRLTGRLDA